MEIVVLCCGNICLQLILNLLLRWLNWQEGLLDHEISTSTNQVRL